MDVRGWVVGDVLAARARERGGETFLEFPAEGDAARLTFAEADALASRVAGGLASHGVRHGARVGVLLPNGSDHCAAWLGIARAGAVHVAVNTALVGSFLAHVLATSEVETLLCDGELLLRVAEIEASLPKLRRVFVRARAGIALPRFARVEVTSIDALLDARAAPPDVSVSYRDLACIMFTSGTTGPSKGVLMPHAHCYLLGFGLVDCLGVTDRDAYYICLPLFHANAIFMQLYACLIAGARAVVVPKFSASSWLADIRRHRCTITNTIGVMTEFVMRQPPRPDDADGPLRLVLAVPTPPDLAPAFRARFGAEIVEGYGMTEVNMPIYTRPGAWRPGSCGTAYDRFFEVRVVDPESDEERAPGEIGEIVVRPKQPFAFMAGYDKMPDKTVEAWRNLWFHTGDAGARDEGGHFYFVDRIKDCIRRRGENISSYEIECALLEHPAVLEAAAVALPSDVNGGEDEVKLCVVAKPDARVDAAEIAAFCDGRLPAFARPRYVEIMEALPKTPTAKVQKAKLRAAGITAATWDRERRAAR